MARREQKKRCNAANEMGMSPKQIIVADEDWFAKRNQADILEGEPEQVILSVLGSAFLNLGVVVPVADSDARDFATALSDLCEAAGDQQAFVKTLGIYEGMFPAEIASLRENLSEAGVPVCIAAAS